MKFFEEMKWRGLVENTSHDEIEEQLNDKKISFYAGFDPTSRSLQIGNLMTVMTMKRLQLAGHTPYVLVGGATGMIGDPSGKSDERNLLSTDDLEKNVEALKDQLSRFLNFSGENAAVMVNNADWTAGISFLEFLRDVGKRFRLSEMLAKDSVKSRLNSDAGISYTEFSYQILQANDFRVLNKNHDVKLQIGGGDQWGNITAGIDLSRKMNGNQVFGLVTPLVLDASGQKFGKSVGGKTIYLDSEMTSPYQMYQYLMNSDDKNVVTYLKYFSFKSVEEIQNLEKETAEQPHLRTAQKALASEVVEMVHGKEALEMAIKATQFFFGQKIENLDDREIEDIFSEIPSVSLNLQDLGNIQILDLLAQTPLFKSKGEARRSLQQKGVYLNNNQIEELELTIGKEHLASPTSLVIRKGKKSYCLVRFN
jgi:tyrosyl-tRNA synthetase